MLGTLDQLAQRIGGRVIGDGTCAIARVTAVDEACADGLTFATDERYFALALSSAAAAVLVDASLSTGDSPAKPVLVVENVRLALAHLLNELKPARPRGPFRHPSATIDASADVAADAFVDANAYIGAGARIGAGSVIGAGAYVGPETKIGDDVWLHPRATVKHGCTIGNRVVLHVGCVVGSDGFGWAFEQGRLERIPHVGDVVLADEVEIGANSCIDRAQTGSTTIGFGTKIDNLVQIGHNCHIGKHCAIASQTGMAGSTSVGDYVKIAGQVGTRGHMHIGSRVTVGGKAGVWSDIPDDATITGNPARDHREYLKQEVILRRLPKLVARVDAIEREQKRNAP
jgi:UDP-3-O-[3-hydroxymyristoyl] glucosamine N-acyltransferase